MASDAEVVIFEVVMVVVEHPTEEEVPLAFFEGCLRLLAEDEIRLLSSLSSLLWLDFLSFWGCCCCCCLEVIVEGAAASFPRESALLDLRLNFDSSLITFRGLRESLNNRLNFGILFFTGTTTAVASGIGGCWCCCCCCLGFCQISMSEEVSVDWDLPKTVRSSLRLLLLLVLDGRCIMEAFPALEEEFGWLCPPPPPPEDELIELHPDGELLLGIEDDVLEVMLLPSEAKSPLFLILLCCCCGSLSNSSSGSEPERPFPGERRKGNGTQLPLMEAELEEEAVIEADAAVKPPVGLQFKSGLLAPSGFLCRWKFAASFGIVVLLVLLLLIQGSAAVLLTVGC